LRGKSIDEVGNNHPDFFFSFPGAAFHSDQNLIVSEVRHKDIVMNIYSPTWHDLQHSA
jgi:hypothetical protein